MKIINALISDIDNIFSLYDAAVEYQKTKFYKHWKGFERPLVETEIRENRLYKIVEDENIACIFSVVYNDPVIWGEKDKDPSMYLHRIVTHPSFRGRSYMKVIIEWCKEHGRQNNIRFIRMDTWGDNEKLIGYYVSCGFRFMGLTTPQLTAQLPKHYSDIHLSLFEIEIN